jgi:hypothetical protein
MRRFAVPLLAALALIVPQQALAAGDFYASQAGGGDCSEASPCSLDTAITQAEAASGGNVRVVGALTRTTTLELPPGGTSPIRLIGSGTGDGGTLFDTGASTAVNVNKGSSIENVHVRTTTGTGVNLDYGGTVSTSVVEGHTGVNSVFGDGTAVTATVDRTTITATNTAVSLGNGTTGQTLVVRDSSLNGPNGVFAAAGTPVGVVVERNTIDSTNTGIYHVANSAAPMSASSNVIHMTGPGATGIRVSGQPATDSLRGNTIDGADTTGESRGIFVESPNTGDVPTLTAVVRDSIVRGFAHDLRAGQGDPPGTIDVATSNFATSTAEPAAPGPAGVITDSGGNVNVDPGWVDRAARDYRLGATSPLIDAGGTGQLADGESATDRAGGARIVDGNRDGTAARDMGAFEFVPPPLPPPPDTAAPVFSSASLLRAVFRVDRTGPAEVVVTAGKRRRARKGTRFRYTLSEAARVVFTVDRVRPGRRVGKRCRKPSRKNRGRKRCKRYTRAGRFAALSPAGPNTRSFSGRIGRRALKPGRYRATLVATDAAGNRSAAKRLRFRVVR